ncbi:MAG: pentapeptide repeat-containing protein, partial [Planctomycetes bacterium]|nr:pentapeptide repeat-containing protein [Planctomycetota bacterium]
MLTVSAVGLLMLVSHRVARADHLPAVLPVLPGSDHEHENLSDLDFRGDDLRNVNLIRADLSRSVFSGADFRGEIFFFTAVEDVVFDGANLHLQDFSHWIGARASFQSNREPWTTFCGPSLLFLSLGLRSVGKRKIVNLGFPTLASLTIQAIARIGAKYKTAPQLTPRGRMSGLEGENNTDRRKGTCGPRCITPSLTNSFPPRRPSARKCTLRA